ncbi:polypyrimidine tract-binding protein 3 [Striga asiatica]|uniref:Polypyrimidine tract-binding protein 3 n=1 Tax=Striga asiatica TaxID=4170 RepID=A0A5A7NW05_STRAF|nr:polypyrimidine tract-binding protein 3 [Striga asiatica]
MSPDDAQLLICDFLKLLTTDFAERMKNDLERLNIPMSKGFFFSCSPNKRSSLSLDYMVLGLHVNKSIQRHNFQSMYFQKVDLYICRRFGSKGKTKKRALFIEGVIGVVKAEVEWNVKNGATIPFKVEFREKNCGPWFWLLK